MPSLTWVITASLRSGSISEMALTNVVLATTILTGSLRDDSEALYAIEHLLQQICVFLADVRGLLVQGVGDLHGLALGEIGDHHPHHADGHVETCGQLDEGGPGPGEIDDA